MKLRMTAFLIVMILLLSSCGPGKTNTKNNASAGNSASNNNASPNNNASQGTNNSANNSSNTNNTNQAANTNQSTNTNTNTVPASNTVDQEKKKQERYDAIYAQGIRNADDLSFFLDGSWTLFPNGALPGTEQPVERLVFDSASSKAELTVLTEDEPKVYMEFSTGKLFEMVYPSEDLIYLDVKDTSETIKRNIPLILDTHNQFQILACRYKDDDIIALREVGNGTSVLALEVMMHDVLTNDGFWIFVRDGGTKSSAVLDEKFETKNRMNGKFYAFRWVDNAGSCSLTPVNAEAYETVFWEDKETVLRYSYSNNGASLICLPYSVKDMGGEFRDGIINPQLVEVKLDSNGVITELNEHPYYSYGVYSVEAGITGFDEEYRDPKIYGFADETYLGSWKGKEDASMTLVVSEASLQTGGYKFEMWLPDGDGYALAECYANIYEKELYVNQGHVNGDFAFEGFLFKEENGIVFKVTGCKWAAIEADQTFFFIRQ